MAEWINTKTGAVIQTECELGGAWVKKELAPEKAAEEEKPKRKKK